VDSLKLLLMPNQMSHDGFKPGLSSRQSAPRRKAGVKLKVDTYTSISSPISRPQRPRALSHSEALLLPKPAGFTPKEEKACCGGLLLL